MTSATAVNPARIDRDEIVRAINLIVEPGHVTELRALDASMNGGHYRETFSGYFDDPAKLAAYASTITFAKAQYIVVNEVNPALLARAANRIRPAKKNPLTSDTDISRRRWLLIDADAVRPADVSSTDAEHKAAIDRVTRIRDDLRLEGWYEPILADSGNGGHLLYRIELPANDEGLIERCLQALSAKYSDDVVKVDTTVFNPSRIWKLYGTLVCKGDNTPDRPHRLARMLETPDVLNPIPREFIETVAGPAPVTPPKSAGNNRRDGHSFDIAEWIRDHNLELRGPEPWKGGKRWVFKVCPWNSDHTNESAFIIRHASGALSAGCHHESCKGRDWHSLRDLYGLNRKSSGQNVHPKASIIRPKLICAANVEPKDIAWLHKPKLALGKLNIFCGDPGGNKSCLALDMAAHVTTGCPWHDGTPCPIGSAILMTAEDDYADTIRRRLDAACADVSKVHFLDGIIVPDENGGERTKAVSLQSIGIVEDALKTISDCRLLVVDPSSAFLDEKDSHRDADIRGLLAPWARVAGEYGVCVVMITHLNKSGGMKAMYRAMGTLAFVAAARSAWLVAKDKKIARRRLVLPIKNNLGDDTTGMAFTVESTEKDVPYLAWEAEPLRMTADEALSEADDEQEHKTGPEPEAREAAEEWLQTLLATGPLESSRVKDEAKAAGNSWATVRRAKDQLGIKPYRNQFGGAWMWKLPLAHVEGAQVEDAHLHQHLSNMSI